MSGHTVWRTPEVQKIWSAKIHRGGPMDFGAGFVHGDEIHRDLLFMRACHWDEVRKELGFTKAVLSWTTLPDNWV